MRTRTGEWPEDLRIFCADVGSIARDNFAWACGTATSDDEELHDRSNIASLAGAVAFRLNAGEPVALGLEMPLFVPVPEQFAQLGKARPCDVPSRAWSSGPGASVMATGLPQLAWLLQTIRERAPEADLHLSWEAFSAARSGLLIWEAFVTGKAKGKDHEADALIGVEAFRSQLPDPGEDDVADTPRPLSLVASAAMWAGWPVPAEAFREPCLLVRAVVTPA